MSHASALAREPLPTRVSEPAVAQMWLSWPRVLDLDAAAQYLTLSTDSVRQLRAAGHLLALAVPGLRVLRFDRLALDHAVETWNAATADAVVERR